MQQFMCTVQFLLCFILNLRTISEYKPPGACIWRGDLPDGFLRYEFEGLILYLEGHIFGTLRHMKKIKPSPPKSKMEKWGVLAFVRLHP